MGDVRGALTARVADRMTDRMTGRGAIPCAQVANMAEVARMPDVTEVSMPSGAQDDGGYQKQSREERAPQKQQRERICCEHPGASTHRDLYTMHGQHPLTTRGAAKRSAAFGAAPGASGHAIRHQRAFAG
jgi:hypothetical protein